MAGKNTISITFKVDGDGKGFRTLAVDAQGLKKLLQSTTSEADQLKKSLVNWSQATQAISAVTDVVSDMASAMSQLSDKMRDTQRQNILVTQLTGKTGEEMLRLRNSVRAVSDHFGLDFYETLRAANNLANAFGITVDDAMKLMRDGLVSGANANGEFIDTIREYPRYFKEAGLSAEEFIAISTNAAKQGIYSDKGVDAIKEGNLRIREMTTATAAALENIGISSERVQRDLQSGATTTFQVMQQVAARLKELPASSAAVGAALADIFGGPGEDAGLEYIKSLDGMRLSMEEVKAATSGTAEQQERQIQIQERVKNSLSGIIDLSKLYTDIQPYVDLTAQIGMTAVGVGALAKTIKTLNVQKALLTVRTKAVNASMLAFGLSTKRTAAFVRIFSAALKTGAYSATALKIALRGLLITTGIGAAIAAVTAIIEHFANKTDDASEAVDDFSEAEEAFTSSAANIKAELDGEIKKLDQLIRAKQDTSEAVESLNTRYGEAFGTYRTASEWYDVLTKKSSTYAKQIGYEAQARILATKIAEKELALEMNNERKRQLESAGQATTEKLRFYNYYDAAGNKNTGLRREVVDTEEFAAARKEGSRLTNELTELERQLGIVQGKLNECVADMQAVTSEQMQSLSVGQMTLQQVMDAISATEKSLKNTTDSNEIADLKAYNDQLKERKKVLEQMTGLGGGSVSGGGGSNAPAWNENASTLGGISDNLQLLRDQLQDATAEEAVLINRQIALWQAKADAIRNAGQAVEGSSSPVWDGNASTLGGIEGNIQILNEKLQAAGVSEAALINQQIALWQAKADAIRNAGTAAGDAVLIWKEEASTLADIEGNIQILTGQLQTATVEEAALINQQISAWNDKAEAIRNAGLAAQEMSMTTGDALMQGWSGIKGIGNSITSITSALEGNGNAWQAVVGIIDGFIGLYQGVQTVIDIVSTLTGVTNMLTAAKQAEAVATTTATTAAVSGAAQEMAASTALATTKSAETTANVAAAASGALSAHSAIPIVGIALGLAAVAAIIAAMSSLPKFAKGGVVSGPTLAMVGEYSGAGSNPEVIAPLDKLKNMLKTDDGPNFGSVRFVIKGRELVGILEKESNLIKRS